MIGRAAWWAALATLAVVATCAQIDRASERDPRFAPFVPKPFRSASQVPLALVATVAGSPQAARDASRALVRKRPLPAEHLFALALADLRAGDAQGYAATFRLATTRGWRPAPLQVAAAHEALASGDFAGAANRIAALWALTPGDPGLRNLTRRVLDNPRGHAAFARNLAGTRVWQKAFLQRAAAGEFGAPARRTLDHAQRLGAKLDCEGLREFWPGCGIRAADRP